MSTIASKGKGRARDVSEDRDMSGNTFSNNSSGTDTNPGSDLSSESDSDSDSEAVTTVYLEGLLAKAKAAALNKKREKSDVAITIAEEEIYLDGPQDQKSLPPLDPGPSFPGPYFQLGSSRTELSSLIRDLDVEGIQQSAPSQPSAPPPPPDLNREGKALTKRQKKELKKATAGPDWFDLPAPAAADLPKLYREVEALRLRNALDPKRFYRKEEGEGKGIKGLPKHFAIGTIIPSSTPFGTPSSDNLTKAQRKRTVVDELVDDAEAKRYAKRKFLDLQGIRGERGRGTWARRRAARRGKW